jgi:REP element-mobilizing transposase RayT
MANTYHQVYIHTIFVVKYREAVIDKLWRDDFHKVIGNLINETGCKNIIINGIEDHVHCLIGLKPTVSISELMKSVKSKSSKFVNDQKLTNHRFEWQEGYAVFSYSKSQIEQVYNYIYNQEEHHKKHTFQTEYLDFIKKYEVEVDEKNLFNELQ